MADAAEEAVTGESAVVVDAQWVPIELKKWTAEFTNYFNVDIGGEGMEGMDEPQSQIPKTGDNSHLYFWIIIMLLSGLATIMLMRAEYRETKAGR